MVITGASSGIGRATAHAFADAGARLVLAARSAGSLADVEAECTARGAQALAVPTDVRSEEQVAALVDAAVARFGGIDVWVAAASVFAYGRFEDTPADVFHDVLEVNLHGTARQARAVLPVMRARGRGTLIVLGSVYSRMATPYVSAYVTSKHAVLGLTDAIRQELQPHGIDVCAVLPVTIDTPIYQHSANYMGRPMHPLPPLVRPERVARAIVRLAGRPRPRVIVGRIQRLAIPAHRFAPRIAGRLSLWVMDRVAVREGTAPVTTGTVFEPDPASNAVAGGWRGRHSGT